MKVAEDPSITLGDAFNAAHDALSSSYRNEYFFKNKLVSKIIFGIHNPGTASALLEVPSGRSIADLVIFNGTSTAYEIKTDFDSFSRLPSQLNDYRSRFEYVNVVTSMEKATEAEKVVPLGVGIIGVRRSGSLSVVRPGNSGLSALKQDSIFQLLRQKEALDALRRTIGYEVDVPSGDLWLRTKGLFATLPVKVAHEEALCQLKRRGMRGAVLASTIGFPPSLRALAYGTEMTAAARARLARRLLTPLQDHEF
ncbi:sce7726 family protein [Arthrobacter sp. TMT4-20]